MAWFSEIQYKGLKLSFEIKKKLVRTKSKFQLIEIFETYSHGKLMALDKKIMLTEKDEFVYHEAIAHTSIFSAINPKKILVIGGGDGGTVQQCLKHKYIEQIDLCEIDDEVIKLSRKFLPTLAKSLSNRRVNIYAEDGLKFLKDKKRKSYYDVIIVDSTDPVGMAAKLFGKSFFESVKEALKENGILCTQCESPFFFEDTITKVNHCLKKMFNNIKHFSAPVSTYPSGYWSFVIASDADLKFNIGNYNLLKGEIKCKYYNQEIHSASFMLPNFFKKLIKE